MLLFIFSFLLCSHASLLDEIAASQRRLLLSQPIIILHGKWKAFGFTGRECSYCMAAQCIAPVFSAIIKALLTIALLVFTSLLLLLCWFSARNELSVTCSCSYGAGACWLVDEAQETPGMILPGSSYTNYQPAPLSHVHPVPSCWSSTCTPPPQHSSLLVLDPHWEAGSPKPT